MASYALLGAELTESDMDSLEVVVSVNSAGNPFSPSLALKPEVKVGLSDEYVNAVIAGVEKAVEASGAPTRSALRFRWAAHGLVGSSPWIFEKTSGFVVQLLMLPTDTTERELITLCEQKF